MGMFDTIYIDDEIVNKLNESFKDDSLPVGVDWQTKDLDSCMRAYFLKKDNNTCKLFRLEEPDEKDPLCAPFWTEYTNEENEAHNSKEDKFLWLRRQKGDGIFSSDAYLPRNRRQRNMGELPHQIISVYNSFTEEDDSGYELKEKRTWIEFDLKFTDGVLVGVKRRWLNEKHETEKESEWLKV